MNRKARLLLFLLVLLVGGGLLWGYNERSRESPAARALGLSLSAGDDMVARNYPRAIEKFRQSLALNPTSDTQLQLARSLLKVGQRDEAMQVLKDVADGQSEDKRHAAKMLDRVKRDPTWGVTR